MLYALATLFVLTAISFAVISMVMTLRGSWAQVMAALSVEANVKKARPIVVRRVQTLRPISPSYGRLVLS